MYNILYHMGFNYFDRVEKKNKKYRNVCRMCAINDDTLC